MLLDTTVKQNLRAADNSGVLSQVRVTALRKSYGETRAVDGVSFEVRQGEVFGLLGPNGAGKTSTVEMIERLRGRDGGEIRLCGFDPATQADEVRQRLGVTLQVTALPDKIEVREALTLFASFYRQSIGVDELLALVVLEEKAASRFDQLSGGQQQQRLAALFTQRQVAVLIRAQLADAELEAEFGRRHIKAALALRVNGEFAGVLARGPRAYGQGYLSEELSVLRALAAQLSRALENQRLHEARRKHAIAEEELRKLVAQSELKALRAQIDPHFFFNALNSVAALIQRAPRAAEELLEDVAELFRHAFKQKPEFVTLAEELELVETYLKVERVRLGAKLQIKMAVLPETRAIKIPALTI